MYPASSTNESQIWCAEVGPWSMYTRQNFLSQVILSWVILQHSGNEKPNPHLPVVRPVSFSQILNDRPDDAAAGGSPH